MTAQLTRRDVRGDAERLMEEWRNGTPADAAAALRDQPEFALHRSVVIDLAYEEYLQRERAGLPPSPAEFAQAFPGFQASVEDLIEAHRALVEQPELLPLPEEGWPVAGEWIDGLLVKRELGRGSFGRAYLAEDSTLGRLRVVKVTAGGAQEARVIGGLNHPNVVDVLWSRPVGGRAAVCLPFVGSATLATLIARSERATPTARLILQTTAASPDEPPATRAKPVVFERDSAAVAAAAIGAKLARAVAYLHERGVIHGDVKPTNVVLQPGGSPQVIDFNLAAGEEPAFAIRGTPAYMAPELIDATLSGLRPSYDGMKADVFALGVTLIELFTGRHPYRSPGEDNLAELARELRRVTVAIPGFPGPVVNLLKRCMSVAPQERPAAVEVAEMLDRFATRERTRGERRLRFVLATAAVLMLTGLVVGAVRKSEPGVERAPETAAEFRERGLASLHDGKADSARGDFLSAHERDHDPRDLALAAYCQALTGDQRLADEWNKRAIAAGFDTAEVRNNRGATQLKIGLPENAILELDVALAKDANLWTARFNRAFARHLIAMRPQGATDLATAVADMNEALRLGPESAEIFADAGRLFVEAGLRDQAMDQFEKAVAAGYPPMKLKRDARLKARLGHEPRFQTIVNSPPQPARVPVQLSFVEPR